MKNIFICCLFLSVSGAFGQKIHLGPEFGMNLIQVEKSDLGRDYQVGFYAGASFEYDFRNWFGIKTGLNYSQKKQTDITYDTTEFPLADILAGFGGGGGGSALEDIDFNTYTETKFLIAQHYFEIPVAANFKWNGFNASLGGYCGLMFASRTKEFAVARTPFVTVIDVESLDPSGFISGFLPAPYVESANENSSTAGLRRLDFGIKTGIGYQMNNLQLNLSYQIGLLDYRSTVPMGQGIQRHHFFQSSLIYFFDLDKPANASR